MRQLSQLLSNISPLAVDISETLNVLKYAMRARKIQNICKINIQASNLTLVESLRKEIRVLRQELKRLTNIGESLAPSPPHPLGSLTSIGDMVLVESNATKSMQPTLPILKTIASHIPLPPRTAKCWKHVEEIRNGVIDANGNRVLAYDLNEKLLDPATICLLMKQVIEASHTDAPHGQGHLGYLPHYSLTSAHHEPPFDTALDTDFNAVQYDADETVEFYMRFGILSAKTKFLKSKLNIQ